MTTTLGLLFGEGPGTPTVVTLTGITRQWDTFDEGAQEVIDARIYSGIHFRTADEVGARLGRQGRALRLDPRPQALPEGRGPCS